ERGGRVVRKRRARDPMTAEEDQTAGLVRPELAEVDGEIEEPTLVESVASAGLVGARDRDWPRVDHELIARVAGEVGVPQRDRLRLQDVKRNVELEPHGLPVRNVNSPRDLRVVLVQLGDDVTFLVETENPKASTLSFQCADRILVETRRAVGRRKRLRTDEELELAVPDSGDSDRRVHRRGD